MVRSNVRTHDSWTIFAGPMEKVCLDILQTLLFEYARKNDYEKLARILYMNFYDNILEVLHFLHTIDSVDHHVSVDKLLHISSSMEKTNKDELVNLAPNLLRVILQDNSYDVSKLINNECDKGYFQAIVIGDIVRWSHAEGNTSGKCNTICHTLLWEIIEAKNISFVSAEIDLFGPIIEKFDNTNNQYVFFSALLIEKFAKQPIIDFLSKIKSVNPRLFFFINTTLTTQ